MNHSNDPANRRHESDREDIMREATALRRRASFVVEGLPEPIVVGFRSNNFFSVFIDQDPVYQFDNEGRLRRAYRNGLLYRTHGSTLARLKRVRTVEETQLQRTDLTPGEVTAFISEMHEFLQTLKSAVESGSARLLEQIPEDDDLSNDITVALCQILESKEPLAPPVAKRRS